MGTSTPHHDSAAGTFEALYSPIMEALHDKRYKIAQIEDSGHLMTSYGLLHQRLARDIERTINLLKDYGDKRSKEDHMEAPRANPLDLLDSFQNCTYRAAELFEFYEKDLILYMGIKKSGRNLPAVENFQTKIRQYSKIWKIICNKCKHNHSFLVPIEGYYSSGERVLGFTLFTRKDDQIGPNKTLHKEADVFSYNMVLRSLLADVMASDMESAELIRAVSVENGSEKLKTASNGLPYISVLKKIYKLPRLSFPRESNCPYRDIQLVDQEKVGISLVPTAFQGQAPCRLQIVLNFYGEKIKFILPYGTEVGDLGFSTDSDKPNPYFVRVVFNDHYVF
ncbi:hypothetical protein [Aureimonas sp. D3]|uniref:hypothetical protein n=1 Tax=Aureimonas sp. D3 TaxID=1638164 RepID=UPI000B06B99A|nr:hypothetical protein [Aureimonas sp. D3]